MIARRAGLLLLGCLAGCSRPVTAPQPWTEATRPRWNRQGDLAYLSDIDGSSRCHLLKAEGGQQVASPANVTLAAWDPRQQTLALQYDPDGSENFQLLEWNPQSDKLRPLAVKFGSIHHFGTFSRSGRLAYSDNERSQADFDVHARGARSTDLQGYNVPLRFTPDGRNLLCFSQGASLDQQLFEINLRRGRRLQLTPPEGQSLYLSPNYLSRGRLWMLSNLGADYLGLVEWQRSSGEIRALWRCRADLEDWAFERKSGRLAFSINQQGYSCLQLEPGGLVQGLPEGVYSQLSFRPDGSLALQVDGPAQAPSVWQVPPEGGKPRRLLGQEQLSGELVWPRPVSFQGSDGTPLGGLLSLPAHPRAGLVVLHGGPANQARPTFSPLYLDLARRGVAVLQLDVRGSTGYGRQFAALDDGPGRLGAVTDVQSGADYLRSRGIGQLALMGHSYGGYLAWLSAEQHPETWRCLVVGSAISDPPRYLDTTAAWRRENRLAEYGSPGEPSLSPLGRVAALKMPVFLYHGRQDSRVPFEQGLLMAQALRSQGTRLQWLEFPDEGHRLLTPANRLKLTQEVELFLRAQLGL